MSASPVRPFLVAVFSLGLLLAPAAARAQEADKKDEKKPPAKPVQRPAQRNVGPNAPQVKPNVPAAPVNVKPTETKPADKPTETKPVEVKPEAGKPGAAAGKPGDEGAGTVPGTEPGNADGQLYSCKKAPDSLKIKITFKPETEFKELVQWAMGFTCKQFIYSSAIGSRSSKVTIISPGEMAVRDAWKLFHVALQSMGLTLVEKGKVLEIVETGRAKESPIKVYKRPEDAPSSDQIVRVVIRPEFMSVEDASAVLGGLKSKDGVITPFPNSGVLIITDQGSSIDKMVDVLNVVDEPTGAEKIYIVRIDYADATELSQKLSEIFGIGQGRTGGATPARPAQPARGREAGAKTTAPQSVAATGGAGGDTGAAAPSKIIPDERTNSLIIISSERGYARILALIKKLDQPIEGGEGRIHVYSLANADAEELSNTLNGISQGGAGGARGGRGGQGQPAPAGGGAPGGASGGAVFEGNVKITHDKPTNALVIVSSTKDYLSIKDVIRKLDIPRRQVFVEATILEVSLDKTRNLGVAWHGGTPIDVAGEESLLFGGVQHGDLSSLAINPASLSGLAAGLLGPELESSAEFLGVSIPSFGVMFQLLQNNNDINILSSPHILTTDNEPAEFSVGENIPYQAGFAGFPGLATGGQQTGGSTFPSFGLPGVNIQRQDVALKMKLTPHINESGQVRFELEQEISDIKSDNFGANLGPVWSKRTLKTMIVVKDQQPVVIGGLMSDKTIIRESKVPLLGDIPILGYLFKFNSKKKLKTNLLILLTPYIIQDQSDLRRIMEKKIRERREFVETFTAFNPGEFEAEVDYGHKHGFLEGINQAVKAADEEDALIREADEQSRRHEDEGPVEMPDEYKEGGPSPAPAPEPKID
jgi:general secretion pathway protein D